MKKAVAIAIVTIICAIAIISLSLAFNYTPFQIPIGYDEKGTIYDYTEGVNIVPGEYLEPVYNDITNDFRPMYEEMSNEQYGYFFGELPEFKQNFFTISQLVFDGRITDYARLSENYWKQPEFFPGWFTSVEDDYINNDPDRWTPEGYGCYPAIKEITVSRGTDITVNTYLRTGYATESYQGLVVKPLLPPVAKSLRGNTIFEQPKDADKYLEVSIGNADNAIYDSFKGMLHYTNVDEEDWMLILKPTYQLLKDKYGNVIGETGFPSDWVRVIDYDINIASNTPPGDYVVCIDIVPPCFEINQEFYFSSEHEYYGAIYNPSGHIHKSNIPHFQIIMHILG